VIGEPLQLVAAHDAVRADELLAQELDDPPVGLERRQRLLDGRRELRLGLILLGGGLAGGSSSSASAIPSSPAASSPAEARYGLDSPVGARFSTCLVLREPPLTRTNALRSSGPQEMLVGLKVCMRRRFRQLTVGASSV
jgi:hypothetical protein